MNHVDIYTNTFVEGTNIYNIDQLSDMYIHLRIQYEMVANPFVDRTHQMLHNN